MFAEISPELASELKINNGDHICIVTLRGGNRSAGASQPSIRPLRITERECTRSRCLIITDCRRGVWRAANDLLSISGEPNVPSWKPRRSPATSCPDVCRAAQHISSGSSVTRRNPDNRRFCIPNNRRLVRQKMGVFHMVSARRAKRDEPKVNGRLENRAL